MAALDDHDSIAEEAELVRGPGLDLECGPHRQHARPGGPRAQGDGRDPALGQTRGHHGQESKDKGAE